MLANISGVHLLLVVAVVVLLFGATKLPLMARSLGQSVKILKTELAPEREPGAASVSTPAEVPVPSTVS